MSRSAPKDIDESELEVHRPKDWAAGTTGVAVSLRRGVEQMGPVRTARTLRLLNQREGFDCPGCAWPEPQAADGEDRKLAEFCENGAKAVAEEATRRVPSAPTTCRTAATCATSRRAPRCPSRPASARAR